MEKQIYGYTSYKKALEWYKEKNHVNMTNLRDLDYELDQTIKDMKGMMTQSIRPL